jgi:hypothetical protein
MRRFLAARISYLQHKVPNCTAVKAEFLSGAEQMKLKELYHVNNHDYYRQRRRCHHH